MTSMVPPSSVELDGVLAGHIASYTIGDLYDWWTTYFVPEDYGSVYNLAISQGGTPGPGPGPDPGTGEGRCRYVLVDFENRAMIVDEENRKVVVECSST